MDSLSLKPICTGYLPTLSTSARFDTKTRSTQVSNQQSPTRPSGSAYRSQLASNAKSGGSAVRNKFGFVLKGILRCAVCYCAMCQRTLARANTAAIATAFARRRRSAGGIHVQVSRFRLRKLKPLYLLKLADLQAIAHEADWGRQRRSAEHMQFQGQSGHKSRSKFAESAAS